MKLQDALSDYITQCAADGRSVHTRRQYERHVRLFGEWLHDVGASDEIAAVDHKTVARFFVSPAAKTTADGRVKRAGTVNAIRASLSGFFRFLHDAGTIAENPTRLLRRAICGRPEPRPLPPEDQRRLLDLLATARDPEGRRDFVLFGTLAATGIRIGSAIALDVADIDLDRATIRLRAAKGDRETTVFIPAAWVPTLREHLAGIESGPVFKSWFGTRISQRHAQRRFQIWLSRAGIVGSYRPHSMRHGYAMNLYGKTGDLALVQAALGHRSLLSTTIYARASESRVRAAING